MSDMRVARMAYQKIPQLFGLATIGSVLSNTLIWLVGTLVGRMTINVTEVMIFSIVGGVCGAILAAILGKWVRQPLMLYMAISIGVVVLYAFGPIAAAQAPYMEGAERFTPTTVIATELMHIVSGAWMIGVFARMVSVPKS
jgi:hypothetical protein